MFLFETTYDYPSRRGGPPTPHRLLIAVDVIPSLAPGGQEFKIAGVFPFSNRCTGRRALEPAVMFSIPQDFSAEMTEELTKRAENAWQER